MDLPRLQGGADHPVQPRLGGALGVVHDHLVQGFMDQKVLLHALLAGGGELRDGDEQGTGAVRPGEALDGSHHHGLGAGGVEIGHIHIQAAEHGHGLLHGVGDVVEFQIQEDLVAPLLISRTMSGPSA